MPSCAAGEALCHLAPGFPASWQGKQAVQALAPSHPAMHDTGMLLLLLECDACCLSQVCCDWHKPSMQHMLVRKPVAHHLATILQLPVHTPCRYYTTPKSYLDLITLYTSLLKDKRTEYSEARERLLNGLNKLRETNMVVEKMQADLNKLTPVLEEKTKVGDLQAVGMPAAAFSGPQDVGGC